jgi:transcriptional regulator with XRE-family HTH domain
MGISQNAYSKLENNQSKFTIERLKQLAQVLDVPDYELINSDSNIFNFTNNKTANAYAVYEASVELYQDTITHLKTELENSRNEKKQLLAIIEKLST